MDAPVLVLNANFEPLNVCSTRRAVGLLVAGRAEMLVNGRGYVRTVRLTYPRPSIIRLGHMVKRPRPRVRLTKREIFRRDGFTCQYCGARAHRLTIVTVTDTTAAVSGTIQFVSGSAVTIVRNTGNLNVAAAGFVINDAANGLVLVTNGGNIVATITDCVMANVDGNAIRATSSENASISVVGGLFTSPTAGMSTAVLAQADWNASVSISGGAAIYYAQSCAAALSSNANAVVSVNGVTLGNIIDLGTTFAAGAVTTAPGGLARAIAEGRFKSQIVPITLKTRKGEVGFDTDEHPRAGTTMESLAKMKPAFKKDGTVTAGNASGINDAASFLVLADAARAAAAGWKPIGRLVAYAVAGVPNDVMGEGPIPSSKLALRRAGLALDHMDVIESNEAFAVQSLAVANGLGLDPEKTNPNGGAVALGHPVGATGGVLVTKLLHELHRTGGRYGMVTMCIGGGQGITTVWERM